MKRLKVLWCKKCIQPYGCIEIFEDGDGYEVWRLCDTCLSDTGFKVLYAKVGCKFLEYLKTGKQPNIKLGYCVNCSKGEI